MEAITGIIENLTSSRFWSPDGDSDPVRALFTLVMGSILVYLAARLVRAVLLRRTSPHIAMVFEKSIRWIGGGLVAVTFLIELGFNLAAILGAAGIATVAIGFAAQTSISNIISGLFLYGEKPFEVGDIVRIGETVGIVLSIDLMSVKLRTFDNLFIRVPNENLFKSQLTNVTRFPIRRLDLRFQVPHSVDPEKLQAVLSEIARDNLACLEEPEPLILPDRFVDSGVEYLFAVWFEKTRFLEVKRTLMSELQNRFRREEIPLLRPHRIIITQPEDSAGLSALLSTHPPVTAEPEKSDAASAGTGPPSS